MAPPKLLTPSRPASVHQRWPRLALCTCGEEILLALSFGQPYRLEPCEILPPGTCEGCHGAGVVVGELRHVTTSNGDAKAAHYAVGAVTCSLCGGTGRRGEEPSSEHVLVCADSGFGEPFDGIQPPWHGAHRRHRCAA